MQQTVSLVDWGQVSSMSPAEVAQAWRELAGFVWAVGRQREAEMNTPGPPVERFKEAGKHPHGKDNPRNKHAIGTAVPNSRH